MLGSYHCVKGGFMPELRKTSSRALSAGAIAIGCLLLAASGASAATIGQAAVADGTQCGTPTYAQTGVSGGTPYTVPSSGTLTSFATGAWNADGGTLRLVVVRPSQNNLVVALSAESVTLPTSAPPSVLATPITPIPVQAGDIIGFASPEANFFIHCGTFTGDDADSRITAPAVLSAGQAGAFPNGGGGVRASISANFVPDTVPACDMTLAVRGCWHFDETSGTVAADSSGFHNNGTYLNGPTLGVLGVLNGAVSMDGVNDSVRVPDSDSLDVGSTFTLAGWIKRSSTSKSHLMMLKGFQLIVMAASSGNEVWLRKPNVTTLARSNAPVLADGAYHHIVATLNGPGSTAKIYIDGVDHTAPTSAPQSIVDTTSPLTFGDINSSEAKFDEFAIYDEPLTAAQVADLYAAGAAH
jgi:hypothetical protein